MKNICRIDRNKFYNITTLKEIDALLGHHNWLKPHKSRLIYEVNYVQGIPLIDKLFEIEKINDISVILGERPNGLELFLTTSDYKNYRYGFFYSNITYLIQERSSNVKNI